MTSPLISIALLLMALSAAAYVAYHIVAMRQSRKYSQQSADIMSLFNANFKNPSGSYLVTKVWYSDGHKSSEMVTASSPADAYAQQSDDKRNLEYYIESIQKMTF